MVNQRQMRSLCFVAVLAATIRLVPNYITELAGKAGWLSPLVSLPILLLYVYFVSAFMKNRRDGEGLAEMVRRAGGRVFGPAVLLVIAAAAVFYAGFVLRSSANRYMSTIYPTSGPWPFIIITLLLCLIAALGPEKAIIRASRIFAPLLAAVLVIVLAISMTTVDFSLLLPVTGEDALPVLKGAIPAVDVTGIALTFPMFLESRCIKSRHRFRSYALWLIPICLLQVLLCVAAVGNYSAPVAAEISSPFFALLRDITLFETVERTEALIVALWVLPDFIVVSVLFTAGSRALRVALGYVPELEPQKKCDMKNGRWLIPVTVLSSLGCVLLISQDAQVLTRMSEIYVPASNLAVMFIILPVCFAVGKLRRKI